MSKPTRHPIITTPLTTLVQQHDVALLSAFSPGGHSTAAEETASRLRQLRAVLMHDNFGCVPLNADFLPGYVARVGERAHQAVLAVNYQDLPHFAEYVQLIARYYEQPAVVFRTKGEQALLIVCGRTEDMLPDFDTLLHEKLVAEPECVMQSAERTSFFTRWPMYLAGKEVHQYIRKYIGASPDK
ncbi:hypothetical protein SAMN05421823_110196 [Catalinimonas alkaloidigena]|uniref:Uncharacterized protein n=1 Tax=Catalinimonas alkaloidigena TaxID=1075417 RepID=A0A1G9QJN0_9BACT|nr:hypothetical protein [Catalinimonas alkaloidigena]SDM11218.1 hypothetical protein SAMN05421823_110196 [Catalinimonas alkaloidigena]